MNEQSRRVLNLDRDPHALCACALLVAPMCDPGPPASPLSPTILFPRRDSLTSEPRKSGGKRPTGRNAMDERLRRVLILDT